MDRRFVILSAFILAMLIVGLIWYQLLRQPTDEDTQLTASPTPLVNQPLTQIPPEEAESFPDESEESPDLELVPPPIETKGGLIEEEVLPSPQPVAPTAETGFPSWLSFLTWPLRLALR